MEILLRPQSIKARAVDDQVEATFRAHDTVVIVSMPPSLVHELIRQIGDQAALAQRWADSGGRHHRTT